MIHYIYTLSDPNTNEVRYVGKTINTKRRYKQHLYDKRQTSHKHSWIKSLKNLDMKPIMKVIEECNSDNWEEREIYWISKYNNLTNNKLGGNGGDDYKRPITQESIEKIRQANLGKNFSKEHKEKLSNSAQCRKVLIDNVEYKSIMMASKELNIPYNTIYSRINSYTYSNYKYI